MNEIPAEFLEAMADLTSHHIEGVTIQGSISFDCPLVTQIDGNLWSGGTPAPNALPTYFKYVLNLYPWEKYEVGTETTVRTVEIYDSSTKPIDPDLIRELADWVNEARSKGPTLVHCQAGLNRSALVVATALVRSGMTPGEAIAMLRRKRAGAVLSNRKFETWILERSWE